MLHQWPTSASHPLLAAPMELGASKQGMGGEGEASRSTYSLVAPRSR